MSDRSITNLWRQLSPSGFALLLLTAAFGLVSLAALGLGAGGGWHIHGSGAGQVVHRHDHLSAHGHASDGAPIPVDEPSRAGAFVDLDGAWAAGLTATVLLAALTLAVTLARPGANRRPAVQPLTLLPSRAPPA